MESERQVLEATKRQLLNLANVVGVGLGYKRTEGRATDKLSVVVLVEKKLPLAQLAEKQIVPSNLGDVVTDVIEVGRLKALAAIEAGLTTTAAPPDAAGGPALPLAKPDHTARMRPARPGISIGHYQITAGTFGAVVYDRKTKGPLILSNNHVLANSSSGRDGRARIGDAVLQPGRYDGGRFPKEGVTGGRAPKKGRDDVIGRLYRYIPIRKRAPNLVDCAVAKPVSPDLVVPEILEIGPVIGTAVTELGMKVKKSGRTTGLTHGEVLAVHSSVKVEYPFGVAEFADQIVAGPMSQGGDSGSLVVDEKNRAVGLLFAGSDQTTVFSPIQYVLQMLGVTFVGGK